jgi:hypothetical protein
VKREKGGYAFMMESASIQYIIERECDLGIWNRYILAYQSRFNPRQELLAAIFKVQ